MRSSSSSRSWSRPPPAPNLRPPDGRTAIPGIPGHRPAVRHCAMKPRFRSVLLLLPLFAAAVAGPAQSGQTTELSTPVGQFPLHVTVDYLGMAGLKTVIRIRLRAPELSMAAARRGLKTFSGDLQGSFFKGEEMVQAFKYPVSGELGEKTTFQY